MYSFDWYGFLSDSPIADRVTDVAPPDRSEWPEGKRPNWTGFEWVYLNYPPPPQPQVQDPPRDLPEFLMSSNQRRTLSKLEFLDRFTSAELAAILAAAKSNPEIEAWMLKFEVASEVDLSNERTIAGVRALEKAGLIAHGRADEILAG